MSVGVTFTSTKGGRVEIWDGNSSLFVGTQEHNVISGCHNVVLRSYHKDISCKVTIYRYGYAIRVSSAVAIGGYGNIVSADNTVAVGGIGNLVAVLGAAAVPGKGNEVGGSGAATGSGSYNKVSGVEAAAEPCNLQRARRRVLSEERLCV